MRFVRDRRGQSVVVGTVILFGFLILALALYQVQVVPTENANIEFEHSQTVEGDVTDLRNSVTAAGTVGDGRATSVRLGTRYPQRTFFVNPPPVTGELRTTEQRQLRIENANVTTSGNADLFWDAQTTDNTIEFDTRSLRYRADYRELQDGPNLVYEHSVVAAEYRQTALLRTGQTLVREPSGGSDAGRVTIPLLDGELSENGLERRSVDVDSLSAGQRTVLVEPADGGDTIEIVLPTAVQGDAQVNRTAAEWAERPEVENATPTEAGDGIRLTLPADSYQLRLGLVGVGRNTPTVDESDGYITKISTSGGVAVAEVRDRFNNPVVDAEVEVDLNNDGTIDENISSDESGRVEYKVDVATDVKMHINGTDGDDPEWESVLFEDLGAAGGAGGGGEANPTVNEVRFERGEAVNDGWDLVFDNTGNTTREITRFRLNFYNRPGSGQNVNSGVIIDGGGEEVPFTVGGDRVTLDPSVSLPAGEETLEIRDIQSGQNHWFIMTIDYGDGSRGQYFVSG